MRIVYPEREEEGLGEKALRKVKQGDIIQMERIGFGRIDSKNDREVTVFFAHK